MSSMNIPINTVVEGEVDTAQDQQKRHRLIAVTSDMVSRLYSVMFLVDQATALSSFGSEKVELYKQGLSAAVNQLQREFPILSEFDVTVAVSAETGNIVLSGNNDFTNTILDFIRIASQSPITDLAEQQSLPTEEPNQQ